MKKIAIYLILIFNITVSFAESFEEKQKVFQEIKEIILYEESFAKAYEDLLIIDYAFPTLEKIEVKIGKIDINKNKMYKQISFDSSITKLSYGLNKSATDTDGAIAFYESNNLRENTYIQDDSVYLMFDNSFASHIFGLLKAINKNEINKCPVPENDNRTYITKQTCHHRNHIYIDLIEFNKKEPSEFLMSYHIDKFKMGPIVLDKTKTLPKNIEELISKGAILYDFDGIKYIKTQDEIVELK